MPTSAPLTPPPVPSEPLVSFTAAPRRADYSMTSKIYSTAGHALTSDHFGAWARMHRLGRLPQSPYLRPEFTQAVAAVRNDIEVGIVERHDEPIAFLPYRRMPWNGGRPAGGWLANFQALVAADDFDIDPQELIRACGLRSWRFDQLLCPPPCLVPYVWRSWDAPYVDLSHGYESYSSNLAIDRKHFSEFGRLHRKLARDVGPVRFEAHVNSRAVLNKLFAWKSAQYKRTRERNIFAAAWVCELLDLLLDHHDESFSPLLSVLYAGDRIAAISYALRSGTILHGWFTAFDRELSQYSPGINLLLELFQACESLGIARVDLGKGPEPYKRRFATDVSTVYEGAIDAHWLRTTTRRCWWNTKDWVRSSRLAESARTPFNMVRNIHGWFEMS